mmetsp:Transcript_13828/g.20703  ORF Transcript_13828/g.20703 Transcript_13828/m.20703 type:complete len:471 (+) Transcript_13828:74-1486(+)|eukprot:CAMPEP_0197310548 /NCGR_PEP_ID=MMETSP0891-20130614/9117_1 /TAXON_ID=44058 ORGANISM="Aureoumbra lagunensis, Strain CCMP1510" /NCGR_SAMPLE_ID=MMETSP0891 /ASSEMBLY_ACC=CAM_ASM_000534 /LENGTH=470 /DNA_ID=CAMNT_0042796239 /DNA_START=69 /DNA_END=1481 /DNA_ORIENTATION=-
MVQNIAIVDGYIIDQNPATGEIIEKVRVSSVEEVKEKVVKAKKAQPKWAGLPLNERVSLLKKAIKIGFGQSKDGSTKNAERVKELASLMNKEMGKLENEATEEVEGAVDKDTFLDLIEEANKPVDLETALIIREPHGLVGVSAPWNFPMDEILLLALPSLAAGNVVICKPSEVAPLCGAEVINSLKSYLPEGVLDLVQGDGAVGSLLFDLADMNALTGSAATGKKVMAACANTLKPLVCELGGKDPCLILEDADIEKAAKDALDFSVFNAGQVCCGIERVYIPSSKQKEFEAAILKHAENYEEIAPLVTLTQQAIVSNHVESALSAGARLLKGGPPQAEILKSTKPQGSSFYPLTILSDVPQSAKITREETFGPVVALTPYDPKDEEALVQLANDSEYGLTACVYGEKSHAATIAAKIQAGQVGVNCWPLAAAPPQCPFVGHKSSGFGYHSGFDGWRQFSKPKSIVYSQD